MKILVIVATGLQISSLYEFISVIDSSEYILIGCFQFAQPSHATK